MNDNTLTIFYDGLCPMCSLEMQKLKSADEHQRIKLVDLHGDDFCQQFPDIDFTRAMRVLHGEYQGQLLLGLAVTHRAWTLVGKGWMVAPLRFPVIKQIADLTYFIVAKYRLPISSFLSSRFGIGLNACQSGVCYEQARRNNHRRK